MKTNKPTHHPSICSANYGKCNPSTVTMGNVPWEVPKKMNSQLVATPGEMRAFLKM
jgi:hypothetical protein